MDAWLRRLKFRENACDGNLLHSTIVKCNKNGNLEQMNRQYCSNAKADGTITFLVELKLKLILIYSQIQIETGLVVTITRNFTPFIRSEDI